MNWRKNQNTVQKRGLFMDIVDVISDVVDIVAEDNVIDYPSCSNGANSSGANSSGANSSDNGFFGGTNAGPDGTGAGPFNTDELTITINGGNAIPFIQIIDKDADRNVEFIHITESNIEDKGYQARFGILTPVPSLNNNTDYSLILYDNNRNVIVHSDKTSTKSGYQIITTPKTNTKAATTFIVYKTETCSITVSGIQSS